MGLHDLTKCSAQLCHVLIHLTLYLNLMTRSSLRRVHLLLACCLLLACSQLSRAEADAEATPAVPATPASDADAVEEASSETATGDAKDGEERTIFGGAFDPKVWESFVKELAGKTNSDGSNQLDSLLETFKHMGDEMKLGGDKLPGEVPDGTAYPEDVEDDIGKVVEQEKAARAAADAAVDAAATDKAAAAAAPADAAAAPAAEGEAASTPTLTPPEENTPTNTSTDPYVVSSSSTVRSFVFEDRDLYDWPSLTSSEYGRFEYSIRRQLTYGEIKMESLDKALEAAGVADGESFIDIGSGDGKVVLSAFLLRNFSRVEGIEFVPSRFERSCLMMEVLSDYSKQEINQTVLTSETTTSPTPTEDETTATAEKERNQKLQVTHHVLAGKKDHKMVIRWGDVTKQKKLDVDVVFMCNTCFGDDLMKSIMDLFATLKKGARVICLHDLPAEHPVFNQFELVTRMKLPMTWTSGTNVYVYRKISDATAVAGEDDPSIPTCSFVAGPQESTLSLNFDPETYNPDDPLPPAPISERENAGSEGSAPASDATATTDATTTTTAPAAEDVLDLTDSEPVMAETNPVADAAPAGLKDDL